ncbi:MAG TPA: GxxExxY protein [Gemmatimonadales bacterium]|nr:GxxExxY protein [Gemmatimonadales bacterium]
MIHHRGTEGTEEADNRISQEIIGAAVEVHRALGPGLLESGYQACLAHELTLRGLRSEQQRELPLAYKGIALRNGYRIDLLVEGRIVVEVKAVQSIEAVHRAQLLTYLKLLDRRIGLLINFNVEILVHGVRRIVNGY